ncbi:MAG TPA: alpha-galactosidase [Vicinamibacterales bacterium]
MRAAAGALWGLSLALAATSWAGPSFAADAPRVATRGDAFVSHAGGDIWSIGSGGIELTLAFDSSRTLVPRELVNVDTGRSWTLGAEPDVSVTIGGERVLLSNGGQTTFTGATARTTDAGVRLDFAFEHRAQRFRITRSYAAYPGSPTIETWTRVESTSAQAVAVSGLVGWQLAVPAGAVRWLGGLRGDTADTHDLGAFSFDDRTLEPDERVEIGATRRSTEDFLPFFVVQGDGSRFYGGLMWSGGWRLSFERRGETLKIAAHFPDVTTSLTQQAPLEVPHTFFGAAQTDDEVSEAVRAFIVNGIRGGRPFQPHVTYNTWYQYGTSINEDAVVAEMDRAASLGVELFVLDAGWWVGAGLDGPSDFDSGLGSWNEDLDRFPSSLPSLADYAHNLGMKFGLWVEPARIALSTVNRAGYARDNWLATAGGEYGSTKNAQICLARDDARQWVLQQITALVTRVRPDYLKWDNNFWTNCDRDGHGHGKADGSFAHVRALYDVLRTLRERFPDLLIENSSGGGNQLDFGMLAYTDVGWMDDRTTPGSHVRHNLEGISAALPPAYLLSFVMDGDNEPLSGNDDLALMVRSRTPGVLGLAYRSDAVGDDTGAALVQHIGDYKAMRAIVSNASVTLLTDQAPVDELAWDAFQELAADGGTAIIFAFKGNSQDGTLTVHPRGLQRDAVYDVRSLDIGSLGDFTGEALMLDGIGIVHSGTSRAHVITLTKRER